jgi:hypothetical protein
VEEGVVVLHGSTYRAPRKRLPRAWTLRQVLVRCIADDKSFALALECFELVEEGGIDEVKSKRAEGFVSMRLSARWSCNPELGLQVG